MVTDETARQRPLTRGILGLLAAFLVLYAYPVSGPQTTLASLVPAVMLPVLLHDAFMNFTSQQVFKERLSTLKRAIWRRTHVSAIAYTLMAAMLGSQTVSVLQEYRSLEPLGLPGTFLIRDDPYTVRLYQWAANELVKCPAFYSLPSLPSFYFWTQQRAPTGIISNNSLGLLSPEQQRHAVSDLAEHSELCILMIPALLRYFDRGQLITKPPLIRYIEENFSEVASNGPYHVLRQNRTD